MQVQARVSASPGGTFLLLRVVRTHLPEGLEDGLQVVGPDAIPLA